MSAKNWIQSASGLRVDILTPKPEQITIEDIAHHLAHLCRYTGATRTHYSVAEHSVRMSHLAEEWALNEYNLPEFTTGWVVDMAKWGLLHDASEAYLGDVSRPLKHAPGVMVAYRKLEAQIMRVIADKFGLEGAEPEIVKVLDTRILTFEAEALLAPVHPDWAAAFPGGAMPPSPGDAGLGPPGWSADLARHRFLERYEELWGVWP